jgi:hypothetical protein
MSKQHTPGPWAVEVDKHGAVTVYEAVTMQNLDICEMGGNTNDGSNARLIAAAPDLLEALNTWLKQYSAEEYEDCPEVVQTRAAIAKATGAA